MTVTSINTPALLAVLTVLSGVFSLRLGWRKSNAAARIAIPGGWLLLVAGTYIAILAWGPEFGISYALAGIALCGCAVVFLNRSAQPRREDRDAGVRASQNSSGHYRWLVFLAAGPLAALASCQFVLAIATVLPGSEITRMAISALLFPTLWGITAAVSCMLDHPARQAIIFLVVAALSTLVVYS